jgi:hypothetical protein
VGEERSPRGLAAVLNDKVVTVGGASGPIVWDFTAWGWVQMVIGVVMVTVSLGPVAVKGWRGGAACCSRRSTRSFRSGPSPRSRSGR